MKKLVFLIVCMFLSITVFSQTQEEELKSNNWFLSKVIINGQEYFMPHNDEVADIANLFYYEEHLVFQLCGDTCGTEGFIFTENGFSFLGMVCFGSACYLYENDVFRNYFWGFWSYAEADNQYQYEINPIDSNLQELVVTRNNGNQAYFYSGYMSTVTHLFGEVNIYPNPASSYINISLPDSEYQKVVSTIYDVSGKKVKSLTTDWQEIVRLETNELAPGTYFLEINTLENRGRGYVKKIIKE